MSDASDAVLPPGSGLVHWGDDRPCIRRIRRGRGFGYVGPDGRRITDADERARLAALAVPPAWTDVRICPRPDGHLQATGVDQRGRKQYRYHPDWTEFRARLKFHQLPGFAEALPRIRRRLARDLERDPGDRRFALAAVVSLIDRLGLRVGSRDYRDENGSYGATTLKRRHLHLTADRIVLRYRSKHGARVQQTLRSRKLHRVLSEIDDLPGAELFTWLDADGRPRPLSSEQVNAYLGEIGGGADCTAKTFRTWLGTLRAFETAVEAGDGRLTVKAMSEAAAERLGNTPAMARNSYVHPDVIALAKAEPEARAKRLAAVAGDAAAGLTVRESDLRRFLRRRGSSRRGARSGTATSR